MSITHIPTREEECAERLTGPGKQLLSLLVLGEVLLPLVNFRTDTLGQKHLQYQLSYFDGCILKWFQLLHLVWKVLSGSCSFAVSLSDFCLSCLRCGWCSTLGGLGGLQGKQCQCLGTHWNLTFWPLLYFEVALAEFPLL